MSTDYGVWSRYNDTLAGPPGEDFIAFFRELTPPPASILELGVGSGRLALPLADAGYRVHGVDSSEHMLTLLRANDRESRITATRGDIVGPLSLGTFDVVLLAYNVLSMMASREQQLCCLRAAESHLAGAGRVVIENVAPRALLRQINERNQSVGVQFIDNNVWLNLGRYFPDEERYLVRYIAFESDTVVERSGDLTLISPEQVRCLADQCGLRVVDVRADWDGTEFTTSSDQYVMTLQRA